MLLHPLMALPGCVVGFSVAADPLRRRRSCRGFWSLGIASIARGSLTAHYSSVMDANWLEVVRERSQFLLLQLWRADWS